MTPPLTLQEQHAMLDRECAWRLAYQEAAADGLDDLAAARAADRVTPRPGVPHRVFVAMWIAAWARAEHCPLNITAGRLELHCRYNPSGDLCAAVGLSVGEVVNALGFAVPLILDERRRACAATWPAQWKRN